MSKPFSTSNRESGLSNPPSQKDIYNAIIKDNDGYPYPSGDYFGPILAAIAGDVYQERQEPISVVEVGSNTGALADTLASLLPQQSFSYKGIDISNEAIENGNRRFQENDSREFALIEGNITQPSKEVVASIKEAHLVISVFVGPSIGLGLLLDSIEKLMVPGQRLAVIDRAYTANEVEGFSLLALASFFVNYLKYHQQNDLPIRLGKLLAASKLIYQDPWYQLGKETYRQNAPGSMSKVRKMFKGRYQGKDFQLDSIADSFILNLRT